MILSGTQIIQENLVTNLINSDLQVQPCGIDFTLKKVAIWQTAGSLDLDNTHRILSETKILEFDSEEKIFLAKGSYLIEFNEIVQMPADVMATVQSRSTLFRVGATFSAGVIDPGYTGAIGGLLQVHNELGIILYKNAKIAQWVFSRLEKPSENLYSGRYQGASGVV
jgi:dUTP pyrophosphatase